MMLGLARLMVGLTLLALAIIGSAASPDPFETLGLVRFESEILAPAFTLLDLDSRRVSVSPRSGSATILVFWSTR